MLFNIVAPLHLVSNATFARLRPRGNFPNIFFARRGVITPNLAGNRVSRTKVKPQDFGMKWRSRIDALSPMEIKTILCVTYITYGQVWIVSTCRVGAFEGIVRDLRIHTKIMCGVEVVGPKLYLRTDISATRHPRGLFLRQISGRIVADVYSVTISKLRSL